MVQKATKSDAPLAVRFGFSVVAAAASEATTYPLDMTKTRLQIQGEKAAKDKSPKSGFVKMMFNIVRNEGVTKLYFGVSPAIYRHLIYTTFRMTAYQYLRPKMGENATLGEFLTQREMLRLERKLIE